LAAVAALLLLLFPALAHADMGDKVEAALKSGSILAYALVFVAGVGTSLTPCVYPLIPITLSIFGARGKGVSRGKAIALASVYVSGIGVMYTSLGVGVALTGAAFGKFMGSPYVIIPIAVLFVILAASMFGAFEMNLPQSWQMRLNSVGGAGWGGAFLMGLVGGIIAAPCTGPVLAALLAFVATSRSVLFGGSLLFTYALGMGVLFFVLAATAASLPKSGAWMDSVKSIFGVVMLIAALYFLRNVVTVLHQYGDWRASWVGLRGGLAVVGIAIGGIHLSFHDPSWWTRGRKAAGIGLVVFGSFSLIAWVMTPKPVKFVIVKGETATFAQATAEKKPVVLDFGADWCNPCKEIELQVFGNEEVQQELGRRFVVGKVDATDEDEAITAVRAKYQAATLPTVLLIDSDGKIAHRWKEPMKAEEFLAEARKVH
jgi:thiol:disulfide interchange protein DsbD